MPSETRNFFHGTQIRLKNGEIVDAGEHVRGKIVVLYFSASWCKPCRKFTPIMKELYAQISARNLPIEVLLLPRDFMRFQLDEYYEQHGCSWGVVPLHDPIIQKCLDLYSVTSLPSCRVVDEWGKCIEKDARDSVQKSIEPPKMVELLNKWKMQLNVVQT